jgi:hypothetical protein
MKPLSLLFDSLVVFSLRPFFGNQEFLLGSFMNLPHIKCPCVCFYLALGTWMIFLSLLSNLRLCALMSVNAFIKGDIEIPSWEVPWSHLCEINDWHKSKRTCSTAVKLALRQSEVVKSLGPFNTLRKMLAGFTYPWGYSSCVLHVCTFWSFDRCLYICIEWLLGASSLGALSHFLQWCEKAKVTKKTKGRCSCSRAFYDLSFN